MADTKAVRQSKSKSSTQTKPAKLVSQSKVGTAAISQSHEAFLSKVKPRPIVPGSILDRLDLEQLKDRALQNMRKGVNAIPKGASTEECIEYVLDMVIANLILNGHLDATKAQKMRNPIMKSQIAALCDDMITAKRKISKASHTRLWRARKKSSKSSNPKNKESNINNSNDKNRKRSLSNPPTKNTQKWAIQPNALPITIITDHRSVSKLPAVSTSTMEKTSGKARGSSSAKSVRNASSEDENRQKPRIKSKSVERSKKPESHNTPPPAQTEKEKPTTAHRQQASSEVPSSNHSLQNNQKMISTTTTTVEPANKAKAPQKPAREQLKKQLDVNKNVVASKNANTKPAAEKVEDKKKDMTEGVSVQKTKTTPVAAPSESHAKTQPILVIPVTALPSKIPSSRTLNTIINNSNSSVPSTASPSYQILVDMKGFQNDEISMEVEGRQLIFIASRPRRNEVNVRKVTEIVDVPPKVNMENLKIGRRMDGYVIIEEHEP